MKIYLLDIDYYYDNIDDNDYEIEVYASLEKAVSEGVHFLSKRINDDGFMDYDFTVTEIDPEYAEKFNSKELGLDDMIHQENYGKYEPTHVIYTYNKDGELQRKYLEYRDNQRKHRTGFIVLPEDDDALTGQKFKIGDIVRIKEREIEEYKDRGWMDYWNKDKLYIVRWLPRRDEGQKYFANTYALISIYNESDIIKGLYTLECYERDIELADVELADDSPIKILQKIIKNEITVDKETWSKLKSGIVSLNEIDIFGE